MTEKNKRILDAISMGPGLVINVREKDNDNCIQYVVLRLKKDFAVVSSRNMVFHQVMEDFWHLSEFLKISVLTTSRLNSLLSSTHTRKIWMFSIQSRRK